MSRSARATAIAVLAVVLGLASATTACTGDDSGTTPTAADAGAPGDTGPTTTSARSTPFCAGMIELAERLEEADNDDDTATLIRSTYADLADVVPDEIRADFEAVRQLLVDQTELGRATTTSAPVATSAASDATTADGDGEGLLPSDNPTERLADYVELTCWSTANNPGPPETEPP
jgi:hypothetical protein